MRQLGKEARPIIGFLHSQRSFYGTLAKPKSQMNAVGANTRARAPKSSQASVQPRVGDSAVFVVMAKLQNKLGNIGQAAEVSLAFWDSGYGV